MNFDEYITYHKQGDAGVEERLIAKLCKKINLTAWQSFCFIYYYTMTYNIESALHLLLKKVSKENLSFRTDRRWVGYLNRYEKMLSYLTNDKMENLKQCTTTQQAYNICSTWYYFSRYASFLFLEVYMNVFKPNWLDNITFGWEHDENYTKGAKYICKTENAQELDKFLKQVRQITKDNSFAIETSLCAVEKIRKGTRYNGHYTERLIKEMENSEYKNLVLSCL